MNSQLSNVNQLIIKTIKESFEREFVSKLIKNIGLPSAEFLFKYEFNRKFGTYGELWDGKPNEYIDTNKISQILNKCGVSKKEYDALYHLTGEARVKVLAELQNDVVVGIPWQITPDELLRDLLVRNI